MKDFIALKEAAGKRAMKSGFDEWFKCVSSEQLQVRIHLSAIQLD